MLAIAKGIDRILGTLSSAPKVELKVTVADVADIAKGKLPGGVDVTPSLQALWGWLLTRIPGKRYRKLLTRASVADLEYVRIETRMRTLWRAT